MEPLLPKQLTMITSNTTVLNLPAVPVPDEYTLRGYLPGDEISWAETLQICGFESWNDAKVLNYLTDTDRRNGSRVVEYEGNVVAATFASRRRDTTPDAANPTAQLEGVLDFVVTRPDHRGNGLGKAICTEVARSLVNQGCQSISLRTDDWRLPAIHVYLSLGFEPVMNRSDMPTRWASILKKLKENGRDHITT